MSKKILILLGSANLSGGTYVILQHAQYLAKHGFDVTIALVFMQQKEFTQLKYSPECWHPAITELTFVDINDCQNNHFDLAIFTWWATLFSFEKIHANRHVYFVQSIESRFYTEEQYFLRELVNRTYQLGLPMVTEACWIQNYLQQHFHGSCDLVKNGILKSVYTDQGKALADKSIERLRILVEGPVEIAFKNVARTIELCRQANVGEIWLLTSSVVQHYPGVDRVFSRVPITTVPEIYRSCDVLVKLSYVEGMFGPPLEMFHCGGTAIVYAVTGYDEYKEHDVNALVAAPDDEMAVVHYLQTLQSDRILLARLIVGAKATAKNWIDWEQSSSQFKKFVTKNSNGIESPSLAVKVQQLLSEHLEIMTLVNNQPIVTKLRAKRLYDSGHYGLFIPVATGETIFSILFGKLYREFLIGGLEFISSDNSAFTAKVDLEINDLIQNPNNTFTCQSENGALIVKIKVTQTKTLTNQDCQLAIHFVPIRQL